MRASTRWRLRDLTAVGKLIAAVGADRGARVTLELNGKSAWSSVRRVEVQVGAGDTFEIETPGGGDR